MSFWVYMLHCHGGHFYIGHTDDLDRRVAQHQDGTLGGYTHSRRPVKLVWSESMQTRNDAKVIESRIKGWSRAKKLALIRGDWGRLSELAMNSEAKEQAALRHAQGHGDGK
jgi:putative endonuclease